MELKKREGERARGEQRERVRAEGRRGRAKLTLSLIRPALLLRETSTRLSTNGMFRPRDRRPSLEGRFFIRSARQLACICTRNNRTAGHFDTSRGRCFISFSSHYNEAKDHRYRLRARMWAQTFRGNINQVDFTIPTQNESLFSHFGFASATSPTPPWTAPSKESRTSSIARSFFSLSIPQRESTIVLEPAVSTMPRGMGKTF